MAEIYYLVQRVLGRTHLCLARARLFDTAQVSKSFTHSIQHEVAVCVLTVQSQLFEHDAASVEWPLLHTTAQPSGGAAAPDFTLHSLKLQAASTDASK